MEAFLENKDTGEGAVITPLPKFFDNTVSLQVQGSAALEPLRGNSTIKLKQPLLVDDTRLHLNANARGINYQK